MNHIAENFLKKLDAFSDLLNVDDIISIGLFSHKNEAYRARKNGCSPSYLKMSRKILYPKDAVRAFILERFRDGNKPMDSRTTSENIK